MIQTKHTLPETQNKPGGVFCPVPGTPTVILPFPFMLQKACWNASNWVN